ncbi:MAG TPA: glycosyltransferase [Anaeromyxobacteraceae bacterium]|nr:glycosyltransferase [Anaeromyxobacteraceae bacterium]
MDLTIALEHRFHQTPDGASWTATSLSRASWARYLTTFGRVRLLARVEPVPRPVASWLRVDSDRVQVAALPYFVGPGEYARCWLRVERAARAALAAHPRDAVILRVPGTIGTIAARALRSARRPFGLEVVGDPWDVFAPRASDHLLRAAFRRIATRQLRRLCLASGANLYVTSGALQRRYPPAPGAPSFAASDVELGDEAFIAAPRPPDAPAGPPFRIVHVGTLAALYKAPDLLIRSVGRCARDGLDVQLVILGDGRYRGELTALARTVGIAERVLFAGHMPSGEAVRRELDRAHLFVLPSRQEGMPRAMIEAMARGLPCLGTRVGGIPELLPDAALVEPDELALARRIQDVAADPALRGELSRQNLAAADAFRERTLQPIRERFHRHLATLAAVQVGAAPSATGQDARVARV